VCKLLTRSITTDAPPNSHSRTTYKGDSGSHPNNCVKSTLGMHNSDKENKKSDASPVCELSLLVPEFSSAALPSSRAFDVSCTLHGCQHTAQVSAVTITTLIQYASAATTIKGPSSETFQKPARPTITRQNHPVEQEMIVVVVVVVLVFFVNMLLY